MADLTTKIELYCKANGKTALFGRNIFLANNGSSIETWSVDGLEKPSNSQLDSYDTIAVNKSVEFIQNPTYFITTDYTFFRKGSLPLDSIRQKCNYTYFAANMAHPNMTFENGLIFDTRGISYTELYKCNGVINSKVVEGFGEDINTFATGAKSGHCGIQLALALGYKNSHLSAAYPI